ncbi:hypothetical protein DSO57_1033982 [Entomophthora muscae]|uniref:Uncharacterized protein n=1 Tax=Entomophthora muscae TaxID=34485 RepID=A0ACC2TMQ0_9FUNG|nr:hypothetical protein DSO57_1033982 [Entomophthora muscae]
MRYIIKGMESEAKAMAVPWETLKHGRYLKELTADYFSDASMSAWDKQIQDAQPMYNGLKESCLGFKACFISDFKYEFKALPSYDFVTVVPKEFEKYYPRFMLLTEKLRKALKESTFDAVDAALKDLSPEELKDSLTGCAIGGFFYFKQTVKHTDFGLMCRAMKKAIKALS